MENTHTFLRGLRNREIAKILSRNRQQIDFKDLGSTASHYETVEDVVVLAVEDVVVEDVVVLAWPRILI